MCPRAAEGPRATYAHAPSARNPIVGGLPLGAVYECSFCTAVYHNTDACLGEAKLDEPLAKSASFPWVCPACWKRAAVSIQKAVLKPTAQPAAGRKKRRKRV